jgi:ribonuclease P/MRP protein subunit POP8
VLQRRHEEIVFTSPSIVNHELTHSAGRQRSLSLDPTRSQLSIAAGPMFLPPHARFSYKMTQNQSAPKDITATITLRNHPYSYFHLRFNSLETQTQHPFDELTLRSYLTAALQQYLGLTGTAIPVDILKVEDQNAWIRVPSDDEIAVTAAITQWVGVQGVSLGIVARGTWLGGVLARGRRDRKLWTLEEGWIR